MTKHDEATLYHFFPRKPTVASDDALDQEIASSAGCCHIELEMLPDPDELVRMVSSAGSRRSIQSTRVIPQESAEDEPLEEAQEEAQRRTRPLFANKRNLYLWCSLVFVLIALAIVLPAIKIGQGDATSQNSTFLDNSTPTSNPKDSPIYDDKTNFGTYDLGALPFSNVDPTTLLPDFPRPADTSPAARLNPLRDNDNSYLRSSGNDNKALPTNAWYQNLLLLRDDEQPSNLHRVYAMPYVVGTAGPIPGLRVHIIQKVTTYNTVNINLNEPHALTLGAALDISNSANTVNSLKGYSVINTTPLGVTLEWDYCSMKSTIVKGMGYATMEYASRSGADLNIRPTIVSEVPLQDAMTVDGVSSVNCAVGIQQMSVQKEVELQFVSGKTWLVFFSRPVTLQCTKQGGNFMLQVNDDLADPLIVRMAMVLPRDDMATLSDDDKFSQEYKSFLRRYANVYPGALTRVSQSVREDNEVGNLMFDWNVQRMNPDESFDDDLVVFALPHHQDLLKKENVEMDFCTISLLGPLCPVLSGKWTLTEQLPKVDFRAQRSPDPSAFPALAKALQQDLNYQIPANFFIGAGDTYFSGKALGKLARILLIAEEVQEICASNSDYGEACKGISIPTTQQIDKAVTHLKQGVEVWLSGLGQAPFVYDRAWGGVVSCGCQYNAGQCVNKYPNCPGFTDKLLNFGNGVYNDHHFHYGYHIFAFAVVSNFLPEWGRKFYEEILLLVRDVANPSPQDTYFPEFRHKDWFQGNSWANGIGVAFINGMNQESSSEAIASYESVALFGKTMMNVFLDDPEKRSVANEIYKAGLVLTATEVRSAQRYYQVTHQQKAEKNIYPEVYEPSVVGILWSVQAHYGTWFGNNPYYIYGIQLLPLTPISEYRDNVEWGKEMIVPFSKSCDQMCTLSGWSVGVLAILATIGQKQLAFEQAEQLSSGVFTTPGGGGHSKSNTLWYISTRPDVDDPFQFTDELPQDPNFGKDVTCFQPTTCTDQVMTTLAEGYTCRDRIIWLMQNRGISERGACTEVAGVEYPNECGGCNPNNPGNDNQEEKNCFKPSTCTDDVLDTMAAGFSCRSRIDYVMNARQMSYRDACFQIAAQEYPTECGACDPN